MTNIYPKKNIGGIPFFCDVDFLVSLGYSEDFEAYDDITKWKLYTKKRHARVLH
ncbi:hypothetical protein [Chitiniphilus eburneus]|uniref:hypothetical protein n=1 Tax=Chitiniphilus eburneus TaxID=2571148 RepID=UPI00145DC0C6|nr:hypothetical protein [Chitiniphilus eburneus]